MLDISICIVNYNTKDHLKACLRSIIDDPPMQSFEIIVVDNHSTDGSNTMIRQDFANVEYIYNAENLGYAGAVNQALQKAKGNFIILLNADTLMLPGTLSSMFTFLTQHPSIGIAGCRITYPNGKLQRSCRSYPTLMNLISENFYLDKLFPFISLFNRPFMSDFKYDSTRQVDVIMGAFMAVRRKVIEEIGGMDERFFMYSEETDWCYRTKQSGWEIIFYPDAKIVHSESASTTQNLIPMFIQLHKSHILFIEKYHGRIYKLSVKVVLYLGLILRLIVFSLADQLYKLGSAKCANARDQKIKYWHTVKWYLGLSYRNQ